jgi:hypothetical protein
VPVPAGFHPAFGFAFGHLLIGRRAWRKRNSSRARSAVRACKFGSGGTCLAGEPRMRAFRGLSGCSRASAMRLIPRLVMRGSSSVSRITLAAVGRASLRWQLNLFLLLCSRASSDADCSASSARSGRFGRQSPPAG